MRISGPTYKVGLCIHDEVALVSEEEKKEIRKKVGAYKLTAKKNGCEMTKRNKKSPLLCAEGFFTSTRQAGVLSCRMLF